MKRPTEKYLKKKTYGVTFTERILQKEINKKRYSKRCSRKIYPECQIDSYTKNDIKKIIYKVTYIKKYKGGLTESNI